MLPILQVTKSQYLRTKFKRLATHHHIRLFITCFFAALATYAAAQTKTVITPNNADCLKAIEVKDTVFGPTTPPAAFGAKKEVEGNDKKSLYYFEEEHHTVWYTFKCKCSGTLTFEIVPETPTDDYDFMLFNYKKDTAFCNKIARKEIKPIRSNIARNNKKAKSITGLSLTATEEFVHSGPGNNFSKAVEVVKDQRFYLLVDNVYTGGKGHTLRIHYRCNGLAKAPEKVITKPVVTIDSNFTHIDVAKLDVGATLTLKHINFYPDETRLMPESEPELKNLLKVMKDFPALRIEIGGHVDGKFNINTSYYQNLSIGRSAAIYKYLVENGIDATRLTYRGYGNTKKLYAEPKNEAQAKMNRRVEIKILSK